MSSLWSAGRTRLANAFVSKVMGLTELMEEGQPFLVAERVAAEGGATHEELGVGEGCWSDLVGVWVRGFGVGFIIAAADVVEAVFVFVGVVIV